MDEQHRWLEFPKIGIGTVSHWAYLSGRTSTLDDSEIADSSATVS
tara:strand:+ start:204 stop:338 length:135 start_codon:yes stop_codon:yes gene_type:complete